MPDWLAHVMLGFSVSTVMRMKGYQRVLFLIGNVLPDLVRFSSIFTRFIDSDVLTKFVTFPINHGSHSIIGVIAYALFLSIFFKDRLAPDVAAGGTRNVQARLASMMDKSLFLLILGGIMHLFLDTFMWPWAGGVNWLYPLEGVEFEWSFKAIWPGTYDAVIFMLPITIACVLVEIAVFFKERRKWTPLQRSLQA